ncbi:hypothetical protein Droror1_Dr00003706 [Drosera rotundifolia]
MPQELPGFYYDAEKNRYFPIKGPIPGSSRKSATAQKDPSVDHSQVKSSLRRGIRNAKLIQDRELHGNMMSIRNQKGSFQEEYIKNLVSLPAFWIYSSTERLADAGLRLAHANVETPMGEFGTELLLTGGVDGTLGLFEVGKVGLHSQAVHRRRIQPGSIVGYGCTVAFSHIRQATRCLLNLGSSISSINTPKLHTDGDLSNAAFALVTSMGSAADGGSIYVLSLALKLGLYGAYDLVRPISKIRSLKNTIWTSDCDLTGNRAFVGTDEGVTMVDLETRNTSKVFRSKSDVFALQLFQKENVMFCGFRNGVIVTVDSREMQRHFDVHQVPCPYHKRCETSRGLKPSGQFGRNIHPGCTVRMPSAISSLVSLQLYDQYFLASSMDGSIKLYDNRQIQHGAVQSYEGHVNSHTRIQLAVDPYERFVASGGEDGKVRTWSIKSGELLLEDKISNGSIPTACWDSGMPGALLDEREGHNNKKPRCSHPRQQSKDEWQGRKGIKWGVWLGMEKGLARVEF